MIKVNIFPRAPIDSMNLQHCRSRNLAVHIRLHIEAARSLAWLASQGRDSRAIHGRSALLHGQLNAADIEVLPLDLKRGRVDPLPVARFALALCGWRDEVAASVAGECDRVRRCSCVLIVANTGFADIVVGAIVVR